ncbi:MAG: hypothetical protein ACPLKQ_08725 [Candidatus Bathyarchaeales archaeon]
MPKRIPFIKGQKPDREYDLDNEAQLNELGLNTKHDSKIADKYVHYQNCKHAVIELKSSSLHKAIEQVEATVERLIHVGKTVDYIIVVMDGLNRYERRLFKRRDRNHVLINPNTNKPYQVKAGGHVWNILIFYSSEVDKMYRGLNKYFSGGSD